MLHICFYNKKIKLLYYYIMIIIGNKKYVKLKLNSLIDTFNSNIRFNFALPNNNNGTKYDQIILNNHVYDSLKKNKDVEITRYNSIFNISKDYLNKFYNDVYKYSKISKQKHQNNISINKKLDNLNSPNKLIKLPRIGLQSIFDNLDEKPNVIGFSLLSNLNEKHNFNDKNKIGECHDEESEIVILKWLHNNYYIDATLCSLIDYELPILDCSNIDVRSITITKIIKQYGLCILQNYFKEDIIINIYNECKKIFDNNKNKIEILDKENCSKDERIFYAEKYSKFIKDIYSDNKLFNEIVNLWIKGKGKKINKKTLINRLVYEEGVIKNSGAGWHRDNHDCQFKAIMYLTDVTDRNGNFQFISNSTKKEIGYPKITGLNGNSRYSDLTVENILKNYDQCKKYDIVGKRGTVILVDTTNIHRGNIIKDGERYAITQYFFT